MPKIVNVKLRKFWDQPRKWLSLSIDFGNENELVGIQLYIATNGTLRLFIDKVRMTAKSFRLFAPYRFELTNGNCAYLFEFDDY